MSLGTLQAWATLHLPTFSLISSNGVASSQALRASKRKGGLGRDGVRVPGVGVHWRAVGAS